MILISLSYLIICNALDFMKHVLNAHTYGVGANLPRVRLHVDTMNKNKAKPFCSHVSTLPLLPESPSFVDICLRTLLFEARRSWSNRCCPPDSPSLGWDSPALTPRSLSLGGIRRAFSNGLIVVGM